MERVERWAFTDLELLDPTACRGADEMIADVECEDVGIIVLRNGFVTGRWENGDTMEIPADIAQLAGACQYLFNARTNGLAEEWRNVVVDLNGKFLGFTV